MRASLYEALGIPPTASDEEVRAALRRLIRKYYAKTRDGQGNVEEALRFINHASRILSDPDRRIRYNGELARSGEPVASQVPNVATNAMAASGEGTDVAQPVGDTAVERIALAASDDTRDIARNVHHPGLTEPVASFGRPGIVTVALCTLFGGFIAGAIVLVMPLDTVAVAKQVLVWLTLTLLALTVVYGVVHSFSWSRGRGGAPAQVLMPQTDIAILNWRREKSVFLGTNQPQEDASWIFQLRMAELERAKTGRTSEPRPWNRLGARMFDYAFWGIVLALLLSELRTAGLMPENYAYWLGHPFLAPVLITGTWVAVESLLMASVGTTPGKWLFGCYVQYSISDAYAKREMQSQIWRSFKRAFRVWWEGMGCGFPLFAPILIAIAFEKLAHNHETDWDFAQDCLATHAPPGDAQHGHGRLRPGRDALAVRRRVAPAARGHRRLGGREDRRRAAVPAIDHSEGPDRRQRHHQRDRRHPQAGLRRADRYRRARRPRRRSTPTSPRSSPTAAPGWRC